MRTRAGLAAAALAACALFYGPTAAAQATPLIEEPMAVAPGYEAHMASLTIPPAGSGPVTTAGQMGHRHPASTYAYVAKGAVVSRLGDGPEKRYETGQAWSEKPGEAHYIVNASRTEPATLVVILVTKAGTKTLTEPLPK